MLYIYRASAGSGKTFLLTGFYIELLFRKELTPSLDTEERNLLFNEILAVTFTNKATTEMKERIIKDLKKLWDNPVSSPYYNKIRGKKPHIMSDEEISRRAHEILKGMLTDYSSLHISTIDSFFQQVVRSFAHELNIQGNYEIELDANMVLDHAVSQFLLNLDPKQDKETFDWLLRFSNNRMENGANWNVHRELVKLAQVLISEDYQKYRQQVKVFSADKHEMAQYVEMLDGIIQNWRRKLKEIGEECNNTLKRCNLKPTDFNRGSISGALAWAKGTEKCSDTLRKWANDPSLWFAKKNASKLNEMGTEATQLQSLLQEGVALFDSELMREYNSASAIRKNIYQLGLLSRLEAAANDYCAEQGIKLLSDTTQMLNALVAGQSCPFIYEKTGTHIRSYMIDEFQDTSGMQWSNFSPLLKDSLGYNNRNLIVGDVKQSIYRWRGSDWNLLHSKLNQFEPKMQAKDEKNNELRDNWRSDEKIIRFNNAFFKYASGYFHNDSTDDPNTIEEIYADVEQEYSDARKEKCRQEGLTDIPQGKVIYEVLPGAEGKTEYKESVMRRLPELVIALQQQRREAKDILILCRKRDQCNLCAKALLDYEAQHPNSPYSMKIITQEALLLVKHPVVRALVAVLEYLHDPKSDYCHSLAGICWLSLSAESTNEAIATYFVHPESLPDFESLLNLPLYETIERLVSLLPAKCKLESNFIQAFCDIALQFSSKEGPNLDSFLNWWHDNGHKCSVTTPTEQPAIRIMTIHQSKGLSGKAVIVPFSMETLDLKVKGMNPDLLWCEPKEAPFAHENLILPIEVNAKMENSIFSEDYRLERTRAIIDNLNTAYVAFTRAENELIILTPTPPEKSNATLQSLLKDFFCNSWKEPIDKIIVNIEETEKAVKGETLKSNTTLETTMQLCETRKAMHNLPLIKQTDYSSDSAQLRGTTLHDALSAVIDYTQVDGPVTSLFRSGRAELNGMKLSEILDYIHRVLQTPEAGPWFNPSNRVLNEQDIVTESTHTQRPDRIVFTPQGECIVIDYKTGEEQKKYNNQVKNYMDFLISMGFEKVKGYIWYLETGKIYKVQ